MIAIILFGISDKFGIFLIGAFGKGALITPGFSSICSIFSSTLDVSFKFSLDRDFA